MPTLGADSIWLCRLRRSRHGRTRRQTWNIATRVEARAFLQALLEAEIAADRRVLLGCDICYGFPEGTASKLNLEGRPWRALWDLLDSMIVESGDNANNRFDTAAALNAAMSSGPVPFWGCPPAEETKHLRQKRQARPEGWQIEEFRETDRRLKTVHSIWKLYTTGAVGSQTLTGIPVLRALRDAPSLCELSRVWPFETGFGDPRQFHDPWKIIHAETYLSLLPVDVRPGAVKDEEQVRLHAAHFAELDKEGRLAELFKAPSSLSGLQKKFALDEEGWTLGA